jgi:hypothetical protein
MLLDVLRGRFGALPGSVEARIRDASPAKLHQWALRLATATKLADVLADE